MVDNSSYGLLPVSNLSDHVFNDISKQELNSCSAYPVPVSATTDVSLLKVFDCWHVLETAC